MGRVPIEALDCPNGFICLTGQVARAKLGHLTIERNYDEYVDSSEMEPDEIKAYNDGELTYYWIKAKADILVPNGYTANGTCWCSQTIESSGVGNVGVMVHDTASKQYLTEIEKEELDGLKYVLQILNVDVSNWDEAVESRGVEGNAA
jgi:hypothetical protein